MSGKKGPPPREERTALVNDAILRETVRREMMWQKDYTEFQPSLSSLREATPDKPLVDSFVGRLWTHPEEANRGETEEDVRMRTTLNVTRRDMVPRDKYREPITTSMELGWDQFDVPRFKSMFDHNHKKTDITMNPSRWDPNANVMTVKDNPR